LWDPTSVLLGRNHGLFSRGQMSGSRNLLLPSSVVVGISGALTYSHIRLPGMHRKNFQVLYVWCCVILTALSLPLSSSVRKN